MQQKLTNAEREQCDVPCYKARLRTFPSELRIRLSCQGTFSLHPAKPLLTAICNPGLLMTLMFNLILRGKLNTDQQLRTNLGPRWGVPVWSPALSRSGPSSLFRPHDASSSQDPAWAQRATLSRKRLMDSPIPYRTCVERKCRRELR